MYQNLKNFFPKGAFSYCLFFLMSVFLLACEKIPNSNTKPVFTISNIPVFKQNKPLIADRLQPDNQSKKITESQHRPLLNDKLEADNQSKTITESGEMNIEFIQTPDNSEKTTLESFDPTTTEVTTTSSREKTSIENSLNKLQETKIDNNQNSDQLESNLPLAIEKSGTNAKEATASESFEVEPEPKSDEKDISNAEITTSTEIASAINVPNAKLKEPEIERIKLNKFINYDLHKLEKIMGKPNFILRDDELRLWQYKAGECIIDFYVKSYFNGYSVSFIDIRASRLGDKMDTYTCEKELTDALNL